MGAGMQAAGQISRSVRRDHGEDASSEKRNQERRRAPCPDRGAGVSSPGRGNCGSGSIETPALSAEIVQAALVAALQSREFQSAPQLRAFLGFIVRAKLNDEQEKLKGYTIAVEALGRPEDFNPVTDPIVRVEAARLRRRLEKYYSGSGADDPVRIVIPKGSYAPEFSSAVTLATRDRAASGVLSLQESGREFDAAPPDAGADLTPQETAFPDSSAAPSPLRHDRPAEVSAAPSSSLDDRRAALEETGLSLPRRLVQRSVSPYAMLVFGGFCFLAGYLLARL